ncbi:amphiphysin isoform X10 [Parasteatoda tepidariorum]|uniref:amphiphysin isoform X10 n=1 Tax=Parasteatoda tepidariorum TaxID=114398 RepID=UPI001C71F17C|nr:amphiphysin isoform X9 [Parasteatoda tepidariorum]
MADLNPFSKVLQKHAGRAKERLLQNFGKADRTTDEDFDFHVKNFSKQQNAALRLQKEFKNYHQCLKAMQAARRSLVETVNELYEPCWVGLDQFLIKTEVLNKNYDEFCDKINDELLSPVATHVSQFPDCTNKISKRNRKLLDYDNCRHNLQNLETMKRREESKISKAKEQLEDARNLFEVINTELHSELPAIYDSRVSFFVSHLRCLFITEAQFHNKDSTLLEEISGILESLEETYKKNPLPSFNEKSKNSDELEAKESHSSEKNYKEEDASSSSGSFVFSTPPTTADRNLNLEMLSEMSTVEELTEKEKIVPLKPKPQLVTFYKQEDSTDNALYMGENNVPFKSNSGTKQLVILNKIEDSPSSCRTYSLDSSVDGATALACSAFVDASSPDNVLYADDKVFPPKVNQETEQLASLDKMEDSPSSCRTYTIESAVDSATSLTTSDSNPSATSLTTSDSNPDSDFYGTEKIVPLEPKPLLVSHDKVEDSPSSCHTYSIESAVDSTTSLTTSASSSDNVFGGKNTVPTKRNAGELHLMTLNKMLDSANAFACSGSVEASSPDKVLDGGKNTVPTKRNTGELQLMTLNKMLDSANAFACSDSVEASSPDKALDGEEKSSPKPEYKLRSIYNAGVDSPSLLDYPCSVDSTTSLDFPASVDTSCPDNVPYGDEKSDPVPENKLKTIYKIALDSPTSDNVLYRVKGTYKYTAEDVDELSFNVGDVIDVVAYDDPEEQEDGWLMGIFNGKKGLFPANFTSRI